MNTRTTLIVVAVIAGIFAVGLGGVILVGRLAQGIRNAVSSETARQEFLARWKSPSDLAPEIVFPNPVAGYRASTVETNPPTRDPAIEVPGFRTIYQRLGEVPVEVLVARATALESEAIFARARTAFRAQNGATSSMEQPGRLRLSRSNPDETLEIWSIQDWLFVFRAKGELQADFIRAYLEAISRPKNDK